MKMSKKIRAIASAALISAMVMSMSGISALAAGIENHTQTKPTTASVTLTKEVQVASSSVIMPDTDFTFSINPASGEGIVSTVDSTTGKVTNAVKVDGNNIVFAGELEAVTFTDEQKKIEFTQNDTLVENENKYRKTTNISFDASKFSKPGVFRYVVSEDVPADSAKYDGMSYNPEGKTYYLDVYVLVENDKQYVGYTVVHSTDNSGATVKEDLKFVNIYNTADLTVTKKVTGNQGNKNQKFNITITVNGVAGEKYKYIQGDKTETAKCDENGVATIPVSLTHDESVVICGLSAHDTFSVLEDDYKTSDGYTTKYHLGNEISGNGQNSLTDVSMNDNDTLVSRNVIVENNKAVTTPTGIIMSFAPYILVLALAGVFAVMFLRKKREDF